MIKNIFDENSSFETQTKTINVGFLTKEEKILFANLITMTPGTFVISVSGDDFLIHSIDVEEMNSLDANKISKLVRGVKKTNF